MAKKKKAQVPSEGGIHIGRDVGAGAVIGGGEVKAQQIVGGDMIIGGRAISQTPEGFVQQLQSFLDLVGKAITAGEIPSGRDADDVVHELQRVLEMAQGQEPPKSRIVRRLEDVGDVLSAAAAAAQATGKMGAAVIKAVPIIVGLIQLAQIVF